MNVENLGHAVRQVLEGPPDEEDEPKPYHILAEQACPTLRAIGRAFARVLSDGKTAEPAEEIPELHRLVLTTELASESSFLADADEEEVHFGAGIVECAAKVVGEFWAKCGLEPLKVLVVGPPASGFGRVAARIGAPLIEPAALVEGTRRETSEFGD